MRISLFVLTTLQCLCCIWLQPNLAIGQSQKLDDINVQVDFINESIHGIMVANKLFEFFNQDVNRFVDLESYELQGFNNKDLPTNLFDSSSQDYYEEKSPKVYFDLISSSKSIPEKNKVLAVQLYALMSDIDKKRFDIEQYLDLNDLNNRENLPGIYGLLENCVALYKNFYEIYKDYSSLLGEDYKSITGKDNLPLYGPLSSLHDNVIKTMDAVRYNRTAEIKSNLRSVGLMYVRLKKEIDNSSGPLKDLKSNVNFYPKIEVFIGNIRDLTEGVPVKESYQDYGMPYYTHNKSAIAKVNKYGNGFVHEINKALKKEGIKVMRLLEVPHYYMVVYPKKLEIVQQISSTQKLIGSMPDEILNRAVKKEPAVIRTKNKIFEVELFDHMVQDGDLLSVNFNGDWILESYSLETKSKKLRLDLNPNGKNFLVLYAVSVGQRPPNTMAVQYTNIGGEEVQIILKSDLKVSELIEIRYER